jgi:menaquinone-dependent protoporphyrinogen IX oxidase
MKGIVVYDTSYGNTKKIAETLKESGIEVDLFDVKDVKKLARRTTISWFSVLRPNLAQ